MAPTSKGRFDPSIPRGGKELLTWAETKRQEARGINEREAYLNLAFMLGRQWVTWDAARKTLAEAAKPRRGDNNTPVRITVNKMGGLVERTISRLTKMAPVPECRPVTNEDDDVSTAKVGTRALQHEMNRLHWTAVLPRLYFWVMPLGWSFLGVYWNPESGEIVGEDEDGQVRQGNIELEIVPGVEVKMDPNARDWDEVRWVIRSQNMTREAIFEQYGERDIDGDNILVRDLNEDMSRLLGGSELEAVAGGSQPRRAEKVAVHQLWLRPGGRIRPEGMVVTWSGQTILEGPMPFPYEHGQIPFVPFSLLPGIGKPEGRTWMGDLRGMQQDYNDARSREATIRRTLVPKILAARGQIDSSRLTTRVEVVDYAPTGPAPTWMMPPANWIAQYEQAMQRADMEMGDRAGQAEVSQGRAPAGAPAAAILALQEADETKLAISAKEMAESIERVGFQMLNLIRQFWDEERQVRVWSETGRLDVSRFRGADIQGQLDVHVSSESMMPRSKSARAQLALDLWDRQILKDPAQFIRMLEVPGVGFLQEEFDLDVRQAERENEKLLFNEPAPAEDWHTHLVHINTHNKYRKTPEYEEWDDEAKSRMDAHIREHYAWLQFQTTGQLPPGLAGGGLPGELGGGGQPGGEGVGGQGHYLDPLTGMPSDPLAVATGQAPSSLSLNPPPNLINPGLEGAGSVMGQSPDDQAYRQGS